MSLSPGGDPETGPVPPPERYVSAGSLPGRARVQEALDDTHALFLAERSGSLSRVYPALAQADPDAFGLALASVTGEQVVAGDAAVPFTLMSVAKPFVFALVGEAVGVEEVAVASSSGRSAVRSGCAWRIRSVTTAPSARETAGSARIVST